MCSQAKVWAEISPSLDRQPGLRCWSQVQALEHLVAFAFVLAGSSPASKVAWMRLRASSTAKASAPSSTPGFSSGLGGSPLTSSMSSSAFSCTAVRWSVSWPLSSARLPCSGATGLPLPGLGVLSLSLCPIARTGLGRSFLASR
eukprot:1858825-Amphidinium_carterae.1